MTESALMTVTPVKTKCYLSGMGLHFKLTYTWTILNRQHDRLAHIVSFEHGEMLITHGYSKVEIGSALMPRTLQYSRDTM